MYNKEKEIIVSLISSTLIIIIYSLHVYNNYISVNPDIINDFKFWGMAFLILIPVSIIALIIIHIIFAIINKVVTKEDIETMSDERDKLIELKSVKITHGIFTFGFILAMGSQAFGMQPYVMFITLFASGFVSSVVGEIVKIILYRRGF